MPSSVPHDDKMSLGQDEAAPDGGRYEVHALGGAKDRGDGDRFGAAFITRSQVAGVATVVGLFFAERFAEMFVPVELLRLAPISAAESLVAAAAKSGLDASMAAPLAVTTIYLVAAIGLASVVARRSEVA